MSVINAFLFRHNITMNIFLKVQSCIVPVAERSDEKLAEQKLTNTLKEEHKILLLFLRILQILSNSNLNGDGTYRKIFQFFVDNFVPVHIFTAICGPVV